MLLAAVIVLILIGSVAMFSGKITNILGKKDGLPAEMVDTGGSGMVIEPDTKEYDSGLWRMYSDREWRAGDHRADEYLFSGGFRL